VVGSSLLRLDASSATRVQAGLVGAGLSPAASETPLLGFVPLRRLKVARVHRHRIANSGCGACPCRFYDFGGVAPRPAVPGFAPGNALGVPLWPSGVFPRPERTSRRRFVAPPDVRASRRHAPVVGPKTGFECASSRLHAPSGVCSRVGSVAADEIGVPSAATRAARRRNDRFAGPDPLLTFVLLQGLTASAVTRRDGCIPPATFHLPPRSFRLAPRESDARWLDVLRRARPSECFTTGQPDGL
jgi:hypothetical protein